MANTLKGKLTPKKNMKGSLTNEGRLTGQLGGVGAVVTYASLPDKPSINNVELVGNKTTSDLKISYNDLRDQPVIPDVGEIDERLDDLESDTRALDGGLTTAEGNITSLSGRVTTNEGDISDLQGDTSALDTRLTTVEGDITSLGGRLTTAEGNITSLGGRVTTAEGNITSLDGRVTTNEGNISDLKDDMTQAQSDITQLNSSLASIIKIITTDPINITTNQNGYAIITPPNIPNGYSILCAELSYWGSTTPPSAINVDAAGKYVLASANTTIKDLRVRYIYIKTSVID